MAAISAIVLSLASVFAYSDPEDALWGALYSDYPGGSVRANENSRARGLLVSSQVDDQSQAYCYVTTYGIHLQPIGTWFRRRRWITIPWSKVSRLEVVRPADEMLDQGRSFDNRVILGGLLVAKVELIRERLPLTLAVPWNQAFEEFVPENIEFVKDWDWPT